MIPFVRAVATIVTLASGLAPNPCPSAGLKWPP